MSFLPPCRVHGRLMGMCSCENIVLWRGHFTATGVQKSVNLSINGGEGVSLRRSTVRAIISTTSSVRRECLAQRCVPKHVLWEVSVPLTTIFLIPALTNCGSSTNNQNKLEETDDLFTFPDGALVDGDNVITIVQVRSLTSASCERPYIFVLR